MIAVTGASGHLGRLVIHQLLQKVPASQIVAAVRTPEKAKELSGKGVSVRTAEYDQPQTLAAALDGVQKLLLISSSEPGKRLQQHRATIAAARNASVKLLVYTSMLHASTSSISLAVDHLATERVIAESGLPFVILRNGWYLENYTETLGPAVQHGALRGAAKEGRIAAAARADYAAAAVEVLTTSAHEGKVYELAGDKPFTMTELAAEVSRQVAQNVVYNDMPGSKYVEVLQGMGLPAPVAEMLASADEGIARGDLDDRSGDLHRLIGRATTTLAEAVGAGLKRQ